MTSNDRKCKGHGLNHLLGDEILLNYVGIISSTRDPGSLLNEQYFNQKYPMVFFVAHLWLWIFSSDLFTASRWSPQNVVIVRDMSPKMSLDSGDTLRRLLGGFFGDMERLLCFFIGGFLGWSRSFYEPADKKRVTRIWMEQITEL